jgi:hypothetical protein
LQVGGADTSFGNGGNIFSADGHYSWTRIQPSKNESSIELVVYPTASQGTASAAIGTNQVTRLSGTQFTSDWIGKKFYFGEQQVYRVATVSGPNNLTVTTAAGGAVSFASNFTETFHVFFVQGSGTCNVSGTTVTRINGDPFIPFMPASFEFRINGSVRTVTAFTDINTLTIGTSLSLTNATYTFSLDINDQISTLRLQKMLGADEENLSLFARYDGYWMHSLFAGAGQYRKIVIGAGESVSGELARQLVIQKNGDLSIAGDYEVEAIRVLNQTPANSKNRIETQAAPAGFGVNLRSRGSDTNINFGIDCKGTGQLVVTNNAFGNIIAQFTDNWFRTPLLFNVANDAAAAALGVPVGGFYNTGGTVKQRLV